MDFVNRKDELGQLERWWSGEAPRPALIWGRRRVGKTALVERFGHEKRMVYHVGVGDAEQAELAQLSRTVAAIDDTAELAEHPFRSWREALDRLATMARDEPLLLVLDEFPELTKTSPALPGLLRAFLDRDRSHLRLLICGSAVRSMQAMQEYRAPLYGRFDLTLLLHPFRPHEAAQMLPDLTPSERAVVYGVVGGMPLYLSWWDQQASVRENLLNLAGNAGARLLAEGRNILLSEAGTGDQPGVVLHAIASGKTRFNEISDALGTNPSRYLDNLIELRLVERVQPVTDTGTGRRRLYRIADNFLAFYLGVLSRFRGEIERGLGRSVMGSVVACLDDHMGPVYEEAFREHLRLLAVNGDLPPDIVAVGPWWRTGGQDEIDAVALQGRSRTPVLVGEARWAKTVKGARLRNELNRKAAQLADEPDDLIHVVCAREHVADAPADVRAVTAADIFRH